VQVFVVPGDADSATYERSIWRREAFAGVHVFLSPTFEAQSFQVGDTTIHVHGIAFDRSANPEPLGTLQTGAPAVHIALLHATVDGPGAPVGAMHYFPVDSAELFSSGVSYVALGHLHDRRQISGRNGASACYPGSPEGLDLTEERPRYVTLVELGEDPPVVSFLEVNRRRIVHADLDTTDCSADEVLEKLYELAGDDVMLTAILAGTPREMLDEHALRHSLADSFFWIETRDQTTLSSSPFIHSVAAENTIRGHFVETLQRRIRGSRDAEERAALERALKLGLRSLQRSSAA